VRRGDPAGGRSGDGIGLFDWRALHDVGSAGGERPASHLDGRGDAAARWPCAADGARHGERRARGSGFLSRRDARQSRRGLDHEMTLGWRLVDVVSRLLEPDEREAVCGDLTESGASGGQALVELLGLVARRQASQWAHVAPWLACIGIAVPMGALLSHVSRFWADGWAIDAYVWLNAWAW